MPRDQMVKGYEFAKDQYVTFTDDELKAMEEQAQKAIEITEFVPASAVDPIYFDKPYYLGPEKGGEKAYKLLLEAMRQTGRSALAKWAARGKQYLVLIRPAKGGLVMQQLLYADEVRPISEVPVGDAELKDGELKLAVQLVEQIATDEFHPENYEDDVKKRYHEAIQRKIEGQEITAAPEQPKAQIIDLMEALKASLAAKSAAAAQRRGAAAAGREADAEAEKATGTEGRARQARAAAGLRAQAQVVALTDVRLGASAGVPADSLAAHHPRRRGLRALPAAARVVPEGRAREGEALSRRRTTGAGPVPGFGDPRARLLIVGLAPAAHGGNRTGRVFTGDRSGDFLFAALHRAGFASQPTSVSRGDGLRAARRLHRRRSCAARLPPTSPRPRRSRRCRDYLAARAAAAARDLRAILALGKIAMDGVVGPCCARRAASRGGRRSPSATASATTSATASSCSPPTIRRSRTPSRASSPPASFDRVLRDVRRHLETKAWLPLTGRLLSAGRPRACPRGVAVARAEVRSETFRVAEPGPGGALRRGPARLVRGLGDKRYPVVYALHGLFEGAGLLGAARPGRRSSPACAKQGTVREFLVVAVDGGNSFFVNGPAGALPGPRHPRHRGRTWRSHLPRAPGSRAPRPARGLDGRLRRAAHRASRDPDRLRGGGHPQRDAARRRSPSATDGAGRGQMAAFQAAFGDPIDKDAAGRRPIPCVLAGEGSTQGRCPPSTSTAGPRTATAWPRANRRLARDAHGCGGVPPHRSSCRRATTATSS